VVPVTALWLPILVSAVLVFLASSILHMVLPLHRNDWKSVPDEDRAMDAMRTFKLAPGDYCLPRAESPNALKDPAFAEKLKRGPVVFMTVLPGGDFAMGSNLAQWFVFSVVVSLFAGYLAGAALPPGAEYREVFRFAGTTAFIGYTMAFYPQSIWYKRAWSLQLKNTFDGLVYALLTAGVFGWLWP
jgi:Na+/H+ antiporter NhaA